MSQLTRYDPPAFLPDFNGIPHQLEAWHRAMSGWFDSVIEIERQTIHEAPQFYNAATFDPGGLLVEQPVTWNAFPKELLRRYGRSRALQLADMLWPYEHYHGELIDPAGSAEGLSGVLYRPQEEYCEWRVERDAGTNKIVRITCTSEPPEYWQALFGCVPGDSPDPDVLFPGDSRVLLELYRELVSPEVQLEDLIATTDYTDPQGHRVTVKGQYNVYNKWNTTHGIAHLNSPPNSLTAEIRLGGDAAVLRTNADGHLIVEPDALVCSANFGGANRNSDPTIGATVNALARLGAWITLRNPVGLYMDHIDLSGWEAPDRGNVSDFVRITRGTPGMIERLVIEAPPNRKLSVGDLTIAGAPIYFGGQVAECITVKLVGVARMLPTPIKPPAVGGGTRGALDESWPRAVRTMRVLTDPLPAGMVEAFLHEGGQPHARPIAGATARSEAHSAMLEMVSPDRIAGRRRGRTP